ncbi:radial spoke head protein 9 homolog [Homalodisca vitripennis]|uniref:radial spoke head protein 9 homolog n=1 Tax=Homalodisca vitripennis TaxID=197043 RepID=UPI001EEAA5A6|nr:radial spoke head protein 9 homolog [Homalodisca vitripennis]
MDLKSLYSTVHWLEFSSFIFNSEYYTLLTNSLLILQNENHLKKVFFWGIIQCTEIDYYIVFGYKTDAISDRKFFYSDDCQNWKLLPIPQREHLILTELCTKPFKGDPGLVIEIVDDSPSEDLFASELKEDEQIETKELGSEQADQKDKEETRKSNQEKQDEVKNSIVEDKPVVGKGSKSEVGEAELGNKSEAEKEAGETKEDEKPDDNSNQNNPKLSQDENKPIGTTEELPPITSGELKEEDRLAAIIHIISEETSLAPRGGLFKQTDGFTIHSKAFEGLQLEDADELCSFQHYRRPQQDWNCNLMSRTDYNYAIDFLDTIDKDIPSDCWTAQLVEGDRAIILRNLHWPGFSFFHHLTTPEHGFVYIGAGQRNLDIPFMTQIYAPIIKEKSSLAVSVKTSEEKPTVEFKEDEEDMNITERESSKEIKDKINTSA